MIGQTVSHFKVLEKLGEGGMGVVYKAQDLRLDRLVALKFLPHHLARNDAEKARFLQEAKAASALNHPHVCTIYGIDEHEGMEFIEMEYVDGVTLRQKVAPDGALPALLPLGDIISYATQIGEALQEAHGKGIVHRDIKADNIMINASKQIKVMDFGLAKLKGSLKLTRTSSTVGTLAYMAPEQIQGGEADARSDIFSFGVVLYEMLSGRTPFRGEHEAAMMYSILNEDPEPAQKYRPELSPEFLHILSRSLEKSPDERYQSMQEMLIDLRRLKRESTKVRRTSMADMPIPAAAEIASSRTAPAVQTSVKARPGAAMIGAGVLVILALALAAWYLLSDKGEQHESFQSMKITRMTTVGRAGFATISPDGRYIVHSNAREGKLGLWIRQVATASNVEIVPPSDARFIGTTFSHDGNYVFYVLSDERDPDGALYRVPVLGGEMKRILSNIASPIALSPDGLRCAFIREHSDIKNEEALMVASLDGSDVRKLATRMGEEFFLAGPAGPSWSFDGTSIATSVATTIGGFHGSVAVYSAEDGSQKFLSARTWSTVGRVIWYRDGGGIIFSARDTSSSNYQLWQLTYPRGDVRRITNDVNSYGDVSLGLTANDSALVSVQEEVVSNVWIVPEMDASKAKKLTSGSGIRVGNAGVSWSPDGSTIVYTSRADGAATIWSMDVDGGRQRQLTNSTRDEGSPCVTPDGRSILFCSARSGTSNVWKMDLDGSNPVRLTTTEDYAVRCTPDGKWAVYGGYGAGYSSAWKKRIDGGDPIQLTATPVYSPSPSPDGKFVACLTIIEPGVPQQLLILPIDGGAPVKSFKTPQNIGLELRWSPDGREIYYNDTRADVSNLWAQPLDGTPARQVTHFTADRIYTFALSRDGRGIICSRGSSSSDVVLITGFR